MTVGRTGVFRRMIDEARDYVRINYGASKLEVLDERMKKITEVGYLAELDLPKKLWVSSASVQANEYRNVMQVFVTNDKDFLSLWSMSFLLTSYISFPDCSFYLAWFSSKQNDALFCHFFHVVQNCS